VKGATYSSGKFGKGFVFRFLEIVIPFLLCFLLVMSSSYLALASYTVSPALGANSYQAQTILLQENFDDGVAQGFGNESGNWKVIDGKYTATAGTFRFSTAGDLGWQDYTIDADFINAEDGGLLIRAQDQNNSISLIIRPNNNDIGWNIRKGGNWGSGLNTVILGHKTGESLKVRIEVSGSDFKGYINGELKTTLQSTEFPKGRIGVYLYYPADQYWDNITVYSAGVAPTVSPSPAAPTPASTTLGLMYQATLKDGNYGAGSAISPTTGIVNSSEGVRFISTESDEQSNALINWALPADLRTQFRSHGTISFMFKADRQNYVSGDILGDNYGFGEFNNGQSTFSVTSYRIANGPGIEDDQFYIKWSTWHGGVWKYHPTAGQPTVVLEYDRWYNLGFTWGGPTNNFEIWVSGDLKAQDSQAGAALPWGDASMGTGSGTNIGLGDNHQRGVDDYNSAAGVTFADIRIWDEYRANGDTQATTGSVPPATATMAPSTGLVAYYPFDGDTKDYSGNGNNGTNQGAGFVTGVKGQALSLNGLNQYVETPVTSASTSKTLMAWIYPQSSDDVSFIESVIDSDVPLQYGTGWGLDNGYIKVAADDLFWTPSRAIALNQWQHIAVTYSPTELKLYYNGALVDSKAYTQGAIAAANYKIGKSNANALFFHGRIDEVRIYNRVLTQSEVTDLYGREATTIPTLTPTPFPTAIPTLTPTSSPTTIPAYTPSPSVPPSPTAGAARLTFASGSGLKGSTAKLALNLSGAGDKVGNMDISLSYDPSILQAVKVNKGILTAQASFDSNLQNGIIRIAFFDSQGFSGDGSVAEIDFTVIGVEGTSSSLRITALAANRAADSTAMSIGIQNGTFTVLAGIKGDCDKDGKLTVSDVVCVLQMAVGKKTIDLGMDMNSDGRISSIDARKILRAALGLESL